MIYCTGMDGTRVKTPTLRFIYVLTGRARHIPSNAVAGRKPDHLHINHRYSVYGITDLYKIYIRLVARKERQKGRSIYFHGFLTQPLARL